MKTLIYTITDDTIGFPLDIEAELIDFEDNEPPEIMITDISCNDSPVYWGCLSNRYIMELKDKVFREWVQEANRHG